MKVQLQKGNLEGTVLKLLFALKCWSLTTFFCAASSAVAQKDWAQQKASLEEGLKKAEALTKRALEDAKSAKDEAKRLKKELDEAKDDLSKSKEHSQKLDKRFREVIGKLSGNFSSSSCWNFFSL